MQFEGGSLYFNGGPKISVLSEILVLGGPHILKYLDRGEQFWGGPNLS